MRHIRGPGLLFGCAGLCLLLGAWHLSTAGTGLAASGQAPTAPGALVEAPNPPAGGWTYLVIEDFEGAFSGATWTLSGDPAWGRESYKPHTGSWSGYCAGSGDHAVDPPGPYPNGMRTSMVYGPFDLSNAWDAELLFYHWNKLDSVQDRLVWGASRSGLVFWGRAASGDSEGWQHVNFDLTDAPVLGDLRGEPEVWIGFFFRSDDSLTDEGAYLDDITLGVLEAPGGLKRAYLPLVVAGHQLHGRLVGVDATPRRTCREESASTR